jgi:hypothetical protein
MNSSNSSAVRRALGVVAQAHHQHLVAQRQQARRLEADDRDAALRERQQRVEQLPSPWPSRVGHAGGE